MSKLFRKAPKGTKGAIIFFRVGGHEKAGGSQNFFMRNRGVTKKIKRLLGGYKF